jgi:hypothetical protein
LLFGCWCHVACRLFLLSSHFLASVLVTCPRCAHHWSARSSSRVAFSASAVCVVLTLGSCSVAGKQYAQAILGGDPPFRNGVIGALPLPFGWLPTAQCIKGIRRSAVIGLCRPLWRPLASAEEGAADTLSAGQSVSAGGVTRAKRAVSEVWVGTPVPVDYPYIDGRALFQQLPRQPSQRSRPVPRAKKNPFQNFYYVYRTIIYTAIVYSYSTSPHFKYNRIYIPI